MYHTIAWNRTMVSMLGPHLWNVSGAWQSVPICPKPVKHFFLVCYFLLFTHWDVAYQNIARLCMIWSFYHCRHHVCWNSWCQEIVKDRWSPGNSGEIPRRLCCWSWWAAGSEPIASFSFSPGVFFLRQGLTWHRLALTGWLWVCYMAEDSLDWSFSLPFVSVAITPSPPLDFCSFSDVSK